MQMCFEQIKMAANHRKTLCRTSCVLFVLRSAACLHYGDLPVHSVHGGYCDTSHAIGKKFADVIMAAINNNEYFNKVIVPHSLTPDGVKLYNSLLKGVQKFPHYMDEVHGLADGVGLSHKMVMLWNMQFEWSLYLKKHTPSPPRSDLYLANGDTQTIIGHNEDGDLINLNTSYIIRATIVDDAGKTVENFTAFCYPGQLCGNAFGFNHQGLVMSTNALFPIEINPEYTLSNFLNRAFLGLSPSEALQLVDTTYCSSGFNLNLGDVDHRTVVSVEVSPVGANPVQMHGYDYHFNMYLRQNVSQRVDPSSEHRWERVQQLTPPTDAAGIRGILGDTADKQYPIFRTGVPPDSGVATLATGVFDLVKCTLGVYRGNPGGPAVRPLLEFTLC